MNYPQQANLHHQNYVQNHFSASRMQASQGTPTDTLMIEGMSSIKDDYQ